MRARWQGLAGALGHPRALARAPLSTAPSRAAQLSSQVTEPRLSAALQLTGRCPVPSGSWPAGQEESSIASLAVPEGVRAGRRQAQTGGDEGGVGRRWPPRQA